MRRTLCARTCVLRRKRLKKVSFYPNCTYQCRELCRSCRSRVVFLGLYRRSQKRGHQRERVTVESPIDCLQSKTGVTHTEKKERTFNHFSFFWLVNSNNSYNKMIPLAPFFVCLRPLCMNTFYSHRNSIA